MAQNQPWDLVQPTPKSEKNNLGLEKAYFFPYF